MILFAVVAVVLSIFVPGAHCESNSIAWCYHDPTCNESRWTSIAPLYCNGSRQSPINIVSASATANASLIDFTFQGYSNTSAMNAMLNTGDTVKVTLNHGVRISGGGLSEAYDSLQFHLHWGNGSSVPGSEHTVDGKRYPMELHIVNSKSSYNQNTTLAVKDSEGLSALGFLIEELNDTSGQPASWKILTNYLSNISHAGQSVSLAAAGISLDDLLVGVNRSNYYRYLGSLTTPTCNEAVVWTVFKDTIKVSKDLINLFSSSLHVNDSTSPLMVNVFRSIQSAQPVSTQPKASTSSSTNTSFSLGLMVLSLILRWI
ncbi:carbonic anhydrase 12 [Austrofundulus limnaeus]|uniref:Carbonic anhydrase n=1 Tax=Austrofundulus limnaeus TaxID=52670 RepID=A0A2I4BNK3_AUSLI|nr:PREDICTED: carbonic anhydrase 12-like [Austrofundulus limnaeus]